MSRNEAETKAATNSTPKENPDAKFELTNRTIKDAKEERGKLGAQEEQEEFQRTLRKVLLFGSPFMIATGALFIASSMLLGGIVFIALGICYLLPTVIHLTEKLHDSHEKPRGAAPEDTNLTPLRTNTEPAPETKSSAAAVEKPTTGVIKNASVTQFDTSNKGREM